MKFYLYKSRDRPERITLFLRPDYGFQFSGNYLTFLSQKGIAKLEKEGIIVFL